MKKIISDSVIVDWEKAATRADTVFVGMVVLYQSPEYRVHLRIPCSQIGESLFFFFTSNNPRGRFTVQCNE